MSAPKSRLVELRQRAVGRTIDLVLRTMSGSMKLHPAANPPRRRIEEQDGADEVEHQLGPVVASLDVRRLVKQHLVQLRPLKSPR